MCIRDRLINPKTVSTNWYAIMNQMRMTAMTKRKLRSTSNTVIDYDTFRCGLVRLMILRTMYMIKREVTATNPNIAIAVVDHRLVTLTPNENWSPAISST